MFQGQVDSELVDGFNFDYKLEPRCLVCSAQPELRTLVDQLLVRGETYRRILQTVDPLQDAATSGASPITRSEDTSSVICRQTNSPCGRSWSVGLERGLPIVIGDSPIITNAALLELIRNAGYESIVSGASIPTTRETIQAALALEEIDRSDATAGVDELRRQAEILVGLIRERLPEEEWAALAADFDSRVGNRQQLPSPGQDEEEKR